MIAEEFEHFIVLYTKQGNENNLEHLVGYEEQPTIDDIRHVLEEVREHQMVTTEKNVYMIFLDRDSVKEIFGF